ncbi:MAG TPA: SbcC/MukB-like Walker B domain-containing protein, partial [Acidimicrobiales bacterium]
RRRRDAAEQLARRCADAGVDLALGDDPRGPVAAAVARATDELTRIEASLEQAAAHRAEQAAAEADARVAAALANHLSARGFEKWVLDEAVGVLTDGATEFLRSLSSGAYSLAVDDRAGFCVVDHRNADEVRSARTLSGGETFLASLALALALADQVGQLAADGSARLDSIFLDEGFGTLDPDTLDTVAAAIEELGAAGRMVGIVTHVAELAERVPVRFEVTRGPSGSSVERVAT